MCIRDRCAPDGACNFAMEVREGAPRDEVVGVVNTSAYPALDAGARFVLADGNATSPFAVERCSGAIRVGDGEALDHEARTTPLALSVHVVEPTSERVRAVCSGTISIADANEPPSLDATGAAYTLTEGAAANTTLECDAPAVARDPDERDRDRHGCCRSTLARPRESRASARSCCRRRRGKQRCS